MRVELEGCSGIRARAGVAFAIGSARGPLLVRCCFVKALD